MTPAGEAKLQAHEGFSLHAYPDPLSRGDPWTIGYGCTGQDRFGHPITRDTVWTAAECQAELVHRVAGFEHAVSARFPWWAGLDPVRRDAVINLAFNLGVDGLSHWPRTMADLAAHRFAEASADILNNTKWVGQVHETRAHDVARAVLTGSW